MRMITAVTFILFSFFVASTTQACLATWVDSVSPDGSTVVLNNDTIWSVAPKDVDEASDWMVSDDVTMCNGTLTNEDWEEKVSAHRLR